MEQIQKTLGLGVTRKDRFGNDADDDDDNDDGLVDNQGKPLTASLSLSLLFVSLTLLWLCALKKRRRRQ